MTAGLTAGLIGAHIQRTRLPKALEMMCAEAGISFAFTLIDTGDQPDFDFDACVQSRIAAGWSGVTVTHPHKLQAASFAGAGMTAAAAHLGAANTLVFGDPLRGFNTDYTGFLGAWAAEMGGGGPGRVAMAGAGGVASALAPALAELGATRIDIWDPTPGRAAALAAKIDCVEVASDPAAAIRAANGLVNATALGMGDDRRSAFDPALIGGQDWAFDAVYTPPVTPFLAAATQNGLTPLSGFDLFRHMAVRSFEAYTGLAIDHPAMVAKLEPLRPT